MDFFGYIQFYDRLSNDTRTEALPGATTGMTRVELARLLSQYDGWIAQRWPLSWRLVSADRGATEVAKVTVRVALADAEPLYDLLVAWCAWCKQCRDEAQRVVQLAYRSGPRKELLAEAAEIAERSYCLPPGFDADGLRIPTPPTNEHSECPF